VASSLSRADWASGAIVALVIAACGSSSPPPAQPHAQAPGYDPAELAEIAEGLFDVFETMAVTVEAHPQDCKAMARDLNAVFDKSAPIFARAHEVAGDVQASKGLQAEMRKHEEQEPALVDRISKGLRPCAGDPDLVHAIERMPLLD